ncbi:MAG TPA: ECF-type sigma factor [Tahibacter sp.]|nr:ECF-type sigma factor [Tahibacter sp.]
MPSYEDHPDITALLAHWRSGDQATHEALMRIVYPVLRDIARARLRHSPGEPTLRATELVNEAYMKLVRTGKGGWQNRMHFFAVAARAIRGFIVDHLRARHADKRGGNLPFISLDDAGDAATEDVIDLRIDWLAVHDALNDLEALDPECAQVIEMKFFSGLTTEEIAEALSVSRSTIVRQWRFARAWLADRLRDRQ